jgi:hypothetical protein
MTVSTSPTNCSPLYAAASSSTPNPLFLSFSHHHSDIIFPMLPSIGEQQNEYVLTNHPSYYYSSRTNLLFILDQVIEILAEDDFGQREEGLSAPSNTSN